MAKSGSGGLRGTHTSQSPAEMVALYAWRRSADRGFARSGTSGPHPLAPCNLGCSRCSTHVCEQQMSRSTLHRTEFATKRVRPLDITACEASTTCPDALLWIRAVGDSASQLATRAGGTRGTSRQSSGLSVVLGGALHKTKRQMDNIMYLYEQLGPPDAPTRPRRRRIGGGGLIG